MDQVQRIGSKGIYYGLPVFPDNVEGLTAIVTGANGISGDHMVSKASESHLPTNCAGAENSHFGVLPCLDV